ncbi:MAG: hypothetical protein U0L55_08510 [Acutalibacteraceae bacterium]|nr:hypothetical protein [Acutalibacteraceae bacterium]
MKKIFEIQKSQKSFCYGTWMISFAQVIFANGYVPGFIGNTDSSKNFNFDRQASHFVQATRDMDCFGAILAATEPKCESIPDYWNPIVHLQSNPMI